MDDDHVWMSCDYGIEIVVGPTSTIGGRPTAFAVSYIALLAFSPGTIRSRGERRTPPVPADFLRDIGVAHDAPVQLSSTSTDSWRNDRLEINVRAHGGDVRYRIS